MIDRAEGVRDAVLTAMTDEKDMVITQLGVAVRAALGTLAQVGLGRGWLLIPLPALHRPRKYVLEAAEDGAALLGVYAEAIAGRDLRPTPAARLGHRAG